MPVPAKGKRMSWPTSGSARSFNAAQLTGLAFFAQFAYIGGEREDPWTRPKPSRLPNSPATSAATECARSAKPVAVSSHGQITGYFVGPDEYEEFKRFRESRRSFATAELPEEKVEAIRTSRMDPRHAHLDKMLDPK